MKPYYETSAGQIFCGDALGVLKSVDSCSIQCCITSPPYWALRDYGNENQLGLEPTFQEYITKLCDIFDEIRRVLKDDGICFVVIGDTYAGGGRGFGYGGKQDTNKGCDGMPKSIIPIGLKEKSLIQVPARFSIEMTDRGWILRNEIIWHKPNCMPSSASDRFTVDFEKVFFFSKNKQYKFNQQLEPYQHPINRWGGTLVKRLNGSDEYGVAQRIRDYRPVKEGKNKRCVWSINTKPFSGAHFAVYPESLIEPCILAGTAKGDIILDPFFGAGTTGVAAYKHDRKFVGIELNPEYCEIAKQRIEQELSQKKLPGF